MRAELRPAVESDAAVCGRICYDAFRTVASEHGFPVDWRTEETAVRVMQSRLGHRFSCGVVAEVDGRPAGCAFLKLHQPIGAIGPVTVTPGMQGTGIGRMMMEHLMGIARREGLAGTRLVQAAYNPQSLSLYTRLGYEVRTLLACLHGEAIRAGVEGYPVREGTEADVEACNALCSAMLGYPRTEDLIEALGLRVLRVVEHNGGLAGYTTGVHFRGHTVTWREEAAKALIADAPALPEPGLLVPACRGNLLRWAMQNGLRIIQPLTLMSEGAYQEPSGIFLPSIHG